MINMEYGQSRLTNNYEEKKFTADLVLEDVVVVDHVATYY